MNCDIVVKRVKENATGQSARRTTTIDEVETTSKFNHTFTWNPKNDHFDENLKDSHLLKKLSETTGQDLPEILQEHKKRMSILKWMLQNDIRDYKKVSETIGKYYRDPQSFIDKVEMGDN